MNYLYFAEGTVSGTGTAAMYPASAFLGLDPISTNTTRISFKAENNTAVDDDVLIQHGTNKHEQVARLIARLCDPSSVVVSKFIVVADEANGVYLDDGDGAGLTGTVEVTKA
tara:strand:+ start:165 stop:500 length:336 start_codon:yes stop_codon:yes gene_type:complete